MTMNKIPKEMRFENLIEFTIKLYCKECKTEQFHRIYKKNLEEVIFNRKCVKCKRDLITISCFYDNSFSIMIVNKWK